MDGQKPQETALIIVIALILIACVVTFLMLKPPERCWGPGAIVRTKTDTYASEAPGTFSYYDQRVRTGTTLTVVATGSNGWWANPDGMGKELRTDAGYIPMEVLEIIEPAPNY